MEDYRNKRLNIQSLHANKQFFKSKKLFIMLFLLSLIPLLIQIKPTSAQTLLVPQQYTTIKAAVNAAATGDIIQISPGTYNENNIIISDLITSLRIIGANPTTTIVNGMGSGTVFDIDGTHVEISGLTIRNSGNNYNVIASEKPGPSPSNDYHIFKNNIIEKGAYGISLSLSNQNTIYNNTFNDTPIGGISLNSATSTNITGNTIENGIHGIKLYNSGTNTIAANKITQTIYAIHISGTSSTGNTIKSNTLAGKTAGIYTSSDTTTIERNEIIDGSAGIYMQGKTATLNYNIIKNSSFGIRLYYSSATTTNHNIKNNKITNCAYGIEFTYSYSGTFKANWFQKNIYGVYVSFSSSNTFYQNNFVDNIYQAYSYGGTNSWSSGGEGNYWSDYTGQDGPPPNGIGDTPYPIPLGASDPYPLMDTWTEHDVLIESITSDATRATVGKTVNITVTVRNKGRIGASESFTVTAKRNETTIETKQVTNLAAGATQNLIFHWNTAHIDSGNYTITAQASTLKDELNTDNNNKAYGTVEIEPPLTGDINTDGFVNDQDLSLLKQAYGSTTDSGNWNPNADLNKDNIIDAHDLRLLGENYGKTA